MHRCFRNLFLKSCQSTNIWMLIIQIIARINFSIKSLLNKIGIQVENVRAGEDIEWIQRIEYLGIKSMQPSDQNIYYYGFPSSVFKLIKKWNEYSIANAKLNILTFQKVIYFYLISILALYFLYTWNYIFTEGQWDESSSFIPNLNTIAWSFYLVYIFFQDQFFFH